MSDLTEAYEAEFKPFYDAAPSDGGQTWTFFQMFGEENDLDNDSSNDDSLGSWISSLAFDSTGNYLAVGYNCGQVILFREDEGHTYRPYTNFKSHDSKLDVLTSVEIDERINMLKWYPFPQRDTQRLLTTNDKTIKLFRITDKGGQYFGDYKRPDPSIKSERIYEGCHAYNINSIAFNTDGETFISADDLRINLWNIGINDEVLSTVDISTDDPENVSEVITSADFHPSNCNYLIYSSSKGIVRIGDLRAGALCENQAKVYQDPNAQMDGMFNELIASIGDVKFSPCGRMFCSRDYVSLKIWDIRQESGPIYMINFHDYLNMLCDLYMNNAIFDKFNFAWSSNSAQLITGSYNNNFYICNAFNNNRQCIKAVRPTFSDAKQLDGNLTNEPLMYKQKILHTAWHPKADVLALGTRDLGYFYQQYPTR